MQTRWIQTLLNEGSVPITNKTIIPRAAFVEMTTVHKVMNGRGAQPYFSVGGYGLGWMRGSYQGHEVGFLIDLLAALADNQQIVEHSGGLPGFSAQVVFLPSDKLGIVTLANGDNKNQQELAIVYRIIEDYLKLQRKESERLSSASAASENSLRLANSPSSSESKLPMPLSLTDYAGNYYDPGYGTFTFCAPTPMPAPECIAVLNAFSPFYNVYNNHA